MKAMTTAEAQDACDEILQRARGAQYISVTNRTDIVIDARVTLAQLQRIVQILEQLTS